MPRIQMKIGINELVADGDEAFVKEQIASFMALISKPAESLPSTETSPNTPSQPPAQESNGNGASTVLTGDIEKIFVQDKEALTLRIHPEGKNKAEEAREAFVLILYGHKRLFGKEDFSTMAITDSLRKSGVTFSRVAELADPLMQEGMITKTGLLKGTRYRLTNRGVGMAERIIRELRARF